MARPAVLPLGSAEQAVKAYQSAGGVVEYVLLEAQTGEAAAVHRDAAVAGLAEISRRWDGRADRRSAETGADRTHFRSIESDPDRAVGSPASLREFVGRAFDWDTGRIVRLWTTGSKGGESKPGGGEYVTDGYAEAFSDPPYRLRIDLDEANTLFEQINRQLLGGLRESLRIWTWSTDWSTWFDAGHEWWGSYLWTVDPPDLPWIVVIGASTTD